MLQINIFELCSITIYFCIISNIFLQMTIQLVQHLLNIFTIFIYSINSINILLNTLFIVYLLIYQISVFIRSDYTVANFVISIALYMFSCLVKLYPPCPQFSSDCSYMFTFADEFTYHVVNLKKIYRLI